MSSQLFRVVLFLAIAAPVGCGRADSDYSADSVTPGESLALTSEEIVSLGARATEGDVNATKRLISYYELYSPNLEIATQWQRVAFEQGDAISGINLATTLASRGTKDSCRESVQVLKKVEVISNDPAMREKAKSRIESIENGDYQPCLNFRQ